MWILLLVFIVGLTGDEPATQLLTQNSLSESLEEIRVKLGQKQYLEAYYLLRNAEKQFPGAKELRYLCLNTVKSPLIFLGLMFALISCSVLVILAQ